MGKRDYPAAATAARRFMASIPVPLPIDAFGESYREALRILRESSEQLNDIQGQLLAGQMAMEFDPRDTAALFAYALALRSSGDQVRAKDILTKAFTIRPFSSQIATTLEALHSAAGETARAAQVHSRHLEAAALCLHERGWLKGNFVYYGADQNTARDLQLEFPGATELRVTFSHETVGAYLVFVGLPHLHVVTELAQLENPTQGTLPVQIDPQQGLSRLDNATAISSPPADGSFHAPAVLNFRLGPKPAPVGSTLHLRIRIMPDAELGPWVRQYGTWQHPRVPVASKAVTN